MSFLVDWPPSPDLEKHDPIFDTDYDPTIASVNGKSNSEMVREAGESEGSDMDH